MTDWHIPQLIVLVGHILKFYLDFGVKRYFEKPINNSGENDRKVLLSQIAIRICSIIINSSRAVLFLIENAENHCESLITGTRRTLTRQVNEL